MRTASVVSFLVPGLAALIIGCGSHRMEYQDVPPVTELKKPIVDVAPRETGTKMNMRATQLKKRVAVNRFGDIGWVDDIPFKRDDEVVSKAGGPEQLTEMLINELVKTNRFDVIERKNIEDVLKEMKFGETRWVEKTSAAKAGAVIGAQCIVMLTVGRNENVATQPAGNVAAFIRMVDVSTSRITAAVMGVGPDAHNAIAVAVAELLRANAAAPWTAKVVKIDERDGKKEFIIDSGKDLGVQAGDVFAVFALGEPIKAADGDRVIGYRENGAGMVRVTDVKDQYSIAEPVELTGEVKLGDLVRPAIEK